MVTTSVRPVRPPQLSRTSARLLAAGGLVFSVGGSLHPKEDPPDVSLVQHLHVMFQDPLWWPGHAVLLAGMLLLTAGLWRLPADLPRLRALVTATAAASALATVDMLLHLLAVTQDAAAAQGRTTLLIDVHLWLETVTVPLCGVGVAVLATAGARTRTLGSWWLAPLAVVGGVCYALAAGTALWTDALDELFPAAAGLGAWAAVVGLSGEVGEGVRSPAAG